MRAVFSSSKASSCRQRFRKKTLMVWRLGVFGRDKGECPGPERHLSIAIVNLQGDAVFSLRPSFGRQLPPFPLKKSDLVRRRDRFLTRMDLCGGSRLNSRLMRSLPTGLSSIRTEPRLSSATRRNSVFPLLERSSQLKPTKSSGVGARVSFSAENTGNTSNRAVEISQLNDMTFATMTT